MMWFVIVILATLVNTLVITTIVDIILMGNLTLKYSKMLRVPQFMVYKENRIELQTEKECAGYSTAYILRHYDIPATGEDIYKKIPNKMANGYVYPKEVIKIFKNHGLHANYCIGNLNALKNEVSKGNPVIVFIKVRRDKNWLHFVPVVGFTEEKVFLAESLVEFVNCGEHTYNREISNQEFLKLWNTSMLKMPLYTHTFFVVNKG